MRLSGGDALKICGALVEPDLVLEPRRATLTRVEAESLRDEAVVTWFRGPASFTGEDVVEFSLHGSPLLASRVIACAVRAGARMARAGEFTLRAFLNGKLDLAQAEAVQDLVSATTPQQARMAFDQLQGTLSERIAAIERELFELTARLEASIDFPEEGYHFIESGEVAATLRSVEGKIGALLTAGRRGRVVREGVTAALVGRTNVGKSTIFNALAGGERAIVTDVPGTTRDLLTETVAIEGVPVTIVDTAGTRETTDPVEREGVRRAERARQAADLLIVVLDRAAALTEEDRVLLAETASRPRIVLANKCDVPAAWEIPAERRHEQVAQVGDTCKSETRASRRHAQVGDTCKSETRASRRHVQVGDTCKSETRASRRQPHAAGRRVRRRGELARGCRERRDVRRRGALARGFREGRTGSRCHS